jgi:hypothetical protein
MAIDAALSPGVQLVPGNAEDGPLRLLSRRVFIRLREAQVGMELRDRNIDRDLWHPQVSAFVGVAARHASSGRSRAITVRPTPIDSRVT